MRFQVFLSLWSVTSCLCIDKILEVAKTKDSKPKRYTLSKLRLCHAPLKWLIQTRPHMSTSRCGNICKTLPKHTHKEGRTIILAVVLLLPPAPCPGDAVFQCESESTLFGLPKEDTTRNQWLSCITTLFQNSSTQILESVQHILRRTISWTWKSSLQRWLAQRLFLKSEQFQQVWRFWLTACKYVFLFKEFVTDDSNASFGQCGVMLVVSLITNADMEMFTRCDATWRVKRQYKSL